MNPVTQEELDSMLEMAYEALTHAYAPYSRFKVGACLRASSGKYYMGCNIENAAFTPTNCAERTAMFTAIYAGERDFDAIAIACTGKNPAFPCGVCRQVLNEFCEGEMPVYCGNAAHEAVLSTLSELLPKGFGPRDL